MLAELAARRAAWRRSTAFVSKGHSQPRRRCLTEGTRQRTRDRLRRGGVPPPLRPWSTARARASTRVVGLPRCLRGRGLPLAVVTNKAAAFTLPLLERMGSRTSSTPWSAATPAGETRTPMLHLPASASALACRGADGRRLGQRRLRRATAACRCCWCPTVTARSRWTASNTMGYYRTHPRTAGPYRSCAGWAAGAPCSAKSDLLRARLCPVALPGALSPFVRPRSTPPSRRSSRMLAAPGLVLRPNPTGAAAALAADPLTRHSGPPRRCAPPSPPAANPSDRPSHRGAPMLEHRPSPSPPGSTHPAHRGTFAEPRHPALHLRLASRPTSGQKLAQGAANAFELVSTSACPRPPHRVCGRRPAARQPPGGVVTTATRSNFVAGS